MAPPKCNFSLYFPCLTGKRVLRREQSSSVPAPCEKLGTSTSRAKWRYGLWRRRQAPKCAKFPVTGAPFGVSGEWRYRRIARYRAEFGVLFDGSLIDENRVVQLRFEHELCSVLPISAGASVSTTRTSVLSRYRAYSAPKECSPTERRSIRWTNGGNCQFLSREDLSQNGLDTQRTGWSRANVKSTLSRTHG